MLLFSTALVPISNNNRMIAGTLKEGSLDMQSPQCITKAREAVGV
jgi:hypothetical protein